MFSKYKNLTIEELIEELKIIEIDLKKWQLEDKRISKIKWKKSCGWLFIPIIGFFIFPFVFKRVGESEPLRGESIKTKENLARIELVSIFLKKQIENKSN